MKNGLLLVCLLLSSCINQRDVVCIGPVMPQGMIVLDCGTVESWEAYNAKKEAEREAIEKQYRGL